MLQRLGAHLRAAAAAANAANATDANATDPAATDANAAAAEEADVRAWLQAHPFEIASEGAHGEAAVRSTGGRAYSPPPPLEEEDEQREERTIEQRL